MKAKQRRILREIISVSLQTFLIVGIVICAVFPFSCRITTEGIEIIGGDYAAPVMETLSVIDDKTVQLSFSESVELTDVVVSPRINGISDSMEHSKNKNLSMALAAACGFRGKVDVSVDKSEDGRVFTFNFLESTEVGKSYEIFGIVHDEIGNSLTFCIPFFGYNAKIPKVLMTEIQVKYAKANLKTGVVYRSEFVEFLALTDGNLAGIELVSASDGESKKYEFPAIEVKKGQIFLVHLRTIGDGCVNESANFDEATAEYSCGGVLDLWSENTTSRFNDNADVIFLRNNVDNSILDGFMYVGEGESEWKTEVAEYAFKLESSGIYASGEIENATVSKGVSPKKSFQRVDSLSFYNMAMNDEEIEYPVSVNEESWIVTDVTAGAI